MIFKHHTVQELQSATVTYHSDESPLIPSLMTKTSSSAALSHVVCPRVIKSATGLVVIAALFAGLFPYFNSHEVEWDRVAFRSAVSLADAGYFMGAAVDASFDVIVRLMR
jgi:hypothetical protein